jgi:hypothetical protein
MRTEALSDGWPSLRESEALARLLTHYAELGAGDREVWQDRRMVLESIGPRDLVRLHGQLLARGWLEQNTGATPVLRPGSWPRATASRRLACAPCGKPAKAIPGRTTGWPKPARKRPGGR